jgi:O-antigen/teichoic acid export membrane protein
VDLLAVNAFFGAATTGAYGSVAQISTLLDSLVTTVSLVIRPILMIQFAKGDLIGLRRVGITSVKFMGLALALPIGIICGLAKPILSIWLGSDYQYLSVLVFVLIAHFSINLAVRPLLYMQVAFNKVRWPGIVTLLTGLVNLCLAFLIAWWGKWGYLGVALVGALVWTFRNSIYTPIYTAHIIRAPWWCFYPGLGASLIGTIFVMGTSYGLTLIKMPTNIFTLTGYAILVSLFYVLLVWVFGLSKAERLLINDLSPIKFYKPKPSAN